MSIVGQFSRKFSKFSVNLGGIEKFQEFQKNFLKIIAKKFQGKFTRVVPKVLPPIFLKIEK